MPRDVSTADAADLAREFGDRLARVRPPWHACISDGASDECAAALAGLRNPYWIEDQAGGYHTTGWLGAYEPGFSAYAVAVETSADIAAAVRFARDRGLRLVVKGTGCGNPAVFDAAALALCASWEQYAYPGVPGYQPDVELAEAGKQAVSTAMDIKHAYDPGNLFRVHHGVGSER